MGADPLSESNISAKVGTAAGAAVLVIALVAASAVSAVSSMLGLSSPTPPSTTALTTIPAAYLVLYQQASATCPGLPWTVLAGIGKAESDHGQDTDQTSTAGALGPMQFLPSTFAAYDHPVPADPAPTPGGAVPATPWDPTDAIYAAARLLCANGGQGGTNLLNAVYAYNHSNTYVSNVLTTAAIYTNDDSTAASTSTSTSTDPVSEPVSGVAAAVVAYAQAQIGTPYQWGGDEPGGFDCSGLTHAAYAAAGIAIPRTSEAQWAALLHIPTTDLQPGDLVFFNPGEFLTGLPGHVGIYLGDGQMIDAPYAGVVVRVEPIEGFGPFVGAARPLVSVPVARW